MNDPYIEKAKDEIRNDWFKDHKARIVGEEGLQVIYWSHPKTMMYAVKYVLSGSNVFVAGDVGTAAYWLTCSAILDNIKDFDLSYFTGKLTAVERDRWIFDSELAKEEVDEYFEYMDDEDERESEEDKKERLEFIEDMKEMIDECHAIDHYQASLMALYERHSNTYEIMECAWDFGKRLPYSIIAYWLGLQMAIEQLNNEKEMIESE